MDLYPKGNLQLLPERLLNEQLSKERKYKDVDTISFYEYTTEWWNDYKQIQNMFEKRSIKIYAETEDGFSLILFLNLSIIILYTVFISQLHLL